MHGAVLYSLDRTRCLPALFWVWHFKCNYKIVLQANIECRHFVVCPFISRCSRYGGARYLEMNWWLFSRISAFLLLSYRYWGFANRERTSLVAKVAARFRNEIFDVDGENALHVLLQHQKWHSPRDGKHCRHSLIQPKFSFESSYWCCSIWFSLLGFALF